MHRHCWYVWLLIVVLFHWYRGMRVTFWMNGILIQFTNAFESNRRKYITINMMNFYQFMQYKNSRWVNEKEMLKMKIHYLCFWVFICNTQRLLKKLFGLFRSITFPTYTFGKTSRKMFSSIFQDQQFDRCFKMENTF
jgi:hypothetical protein